jgi:hypothetical protein
MYRSLFVLITTATLLSGIIGTAVATTPITVPTVGSNLSTNNQLSPFNLAYLAYQGYLKAQGIPSNSALVNAIAAGTVTAQDVIQAAVQANRLPEQALSDQDYRRNLEDQLNGLAGT